MKSPCCAAELDDVECHCADDGDYDPECEYCFGGGVVDGYKECSECGEQYHDSDIEGS